MPRPNSGGTARATHNDIKGILGDIDPAEMLAILSLQPTIADIEEASVWLEGDPDVFGAGEPYKAWRRKLSQSSQRTKKRSHRARDSCAFGPRARPLSRRNADRPSRTRAFGPDVRRTSTSITGSPPSTPSPSGNRAPNLRKINCAPSVSVSLRRGGWS